MMNKRKAASLQNPEIVHHHDGSTTASQVDEIASTPSIKKKRKNRPPKRGFLSVILEEHSLIKLMEALYFGRLVKERYPELPVSLITRPGNTAFVGLFHIFDEIISLEEHESIGREVKRRRPRILHVPEQGLELDLVLFFVRASVRLGGGRTSGWKRILGFQDPYEKEEIRKLKQNGFDFRIRSLDFSRGLSSIPQIGNREIDSRYRIWLNLFDGGVSNQRWSLGHGARLGRLLSAKSIRLIVPYCKESSFHNDESNGKSLSEELSYLRKNNPHLEVCEVCGMEERLMEMKRAHIVVGPEGPEQALANLMGIPTITLLSFDPGDESNLNDPDHNTLGGARRFQEASLWRGFRNNNHHSGETLIPQYRHECAGECGSCDSHPCINYISPERVYESIKKLISPAG